MDKTVKVYDLTRPTVNKKASASVTDVSPINVVACHPSGDFLMVGTGHRVLRLYDLNTMQCYASNVGVGVHSGAILGMASSADGSVFASTSADGSVLFWDGVSHRPVNRLGAAHNGLPVFGVQWSRSQRYVLTAGGDNRGRLWDVRNGKCLLTYSMATTQASCEYLSCSFAGSEKYVVMGGSEMNDGGDLALLDARTGTLLLQRANMHEKPVRGISAHPGERTFITGSDDGKLRLFDIDFAGVDGALNANAVQMEDVLGNKAFPSSDGGFLQHIGL
jgi:cleavage stimulation factor subunit 1